MLYSLSDATVPLIGDITLLSWEIGTVALEDPVEQ